MKLTGRRSERFKVPVCSLFTEKIVAGQVCYEADLNQFRAKLDWEDALQKGLSFIVDTNDEYDVQKLLERDISSSEDMRYFTSFLYTDEGESFTVMLKTISKTQ